MFENILRFMACVVIRARQPLIIGILGLSGNTLTKEAVTLVLSQTYFVRKIQGERADETDVWLTIIGASDARAPLIYLMAAFFRWLAIMVLPIRYPDVLVLEMNIEQLGDAEHLMSCIPMKIGVVTQIISNDNTSSEFAGDVVKKYGKLMALLPEDGFAILNADDKRILKLREKTPAKVITYGFGADALLLADNPVSHRELGGDEGFSFKLNYDGKTIPVRLPKSATTAHIEPALTAAAVGIALKMNLVEIVSILET